MTNPSDRDPTAASPNRDRHNNRIRRTGTHLYRGLVTRWGVVRNLDVDLIHSDFPGSQAGMADGCRNSAYRAAESESNLTAISLSSAISLVHPRGWWNGSRAGLGSIPTARTNLGVLHPSQHRRQFAETDGFDAVAKRIALFP